MIELDDTPEQHEARSQAFEEGMEAGRNGIGTSHNPYGRNRIERDEWNAGYKRVWDNRGPAPIETDEAVSCPQIADARRHAQAEARRIAEEAADKNCWIPLGGKPPEQTPADHHASFDYEVKSWPWFFQPMIAGNKLHDMRDKTERPYRVGDRMLLREFDPRGRGYTGREAIAIITYITSNDTPCAMSSNALDKDACILSVRVSELGKTDRRA